MAKFVTCRNIKPWNFIRDLKGLKGVNSRSASLLSMQTDEFIEFMKTKNKSRFFVAYDEDSMRPISSNENLFYEITEFCRNDKLNYLKHEGFFMEIGRRSEALMGAFVWRTNRGQSCGGVRLLQYDNMQSFIKDGLRLSYGMGVKSALAGLWNGGGKGVIAFPGSQKDLDPQYRRNIFLDYGDLVTSLNGCYIAAEDAGVVVNDLDTVHERTRFVTCISENIGGSGNPSVATGKGIVNAMEASLDFLNMGGVDGKTIVSQGCGNVARVIIDRLLDKGVNNIHASDCNEQQLELAEKLFSNKSDGRLNLEWVRKGDTETLSKECDILSPNALGNVLTEETIPRIRAQIVCGAANNQLGKQSDNRLLMDHGITYIVDFLCNRMGIVNCANEAYGRLKDDPVLSRHLSKDWEDSIWNVTQNVLKTVHEKGITAVEAATEIAENKSLEWHPIWPKRGQEIIKDLIKGGWAD